MTDCHTQDMSQDSISKKIRQARQLAGLTQQEASAQIQCAQSTISKKESGSRPIYAWELIKLAKIYNCELDFFV